MADQRVVMTRGEAGHNLLLSKNCKSEGGRKQYHRDCDYESDGRYHRMEHDLRHGRANLLEVPRQSI